MSLLNRITFCSLLALFPLAAALYGNYTQLADGILVGTVFILAALCIIGGRFSEGWRFSTRCLSYPLLGIVILALVQTLPSSNGMGRWFSGGIISADPFETRLFALKLLALIVFGELLIQHVSNKRRLQILVIVVLAVGVASCAFGLGLYFMSHNPSGRSFGQFDNRNHFALLMEMTLGLILGLMTVGWRRGKLLTAMVAASVVGAAIILTNSRGGILSMSFQVGFFLLAILIFAHGTSHNEKFDRSPGQPKRRFNPLVRRTALMAFLLIALTTGTLMVGGAGIAKRFSSVSEEIKPQDLAHRNHTRRLEIWGATMNLIRANPIAGVGFGAYEAAIPEYHDATGEFRLQQAHNDYLELVASGGLIGGCLGACFVIALLIRARKCLQSITDPFRRAVCLGSLTGLVGVAVHSLVDFGLHIFINALVFTALTILASTNVSDKEQIKLSPRLGLSHNPYFKKAMAYSVAAAYMLMFTTAAWASGTASITRLLSYEGTSLKRLSSSLEAIRLSAGDPEAHSSCGLVLSNYGQPIEAAGEYERAVALRPRDYNLWLQLGRAYKQAGEYDKAAESFRRSIRHAPYYAKPHWEMGALLLNLGRRGDAFKELRAAVQSNPELLQAQIALAWKEYCGDALGVIDAVQPQADSVRLALAHFFARNRRSAAAIQLFRAAGDISEHDRRALVRELVRDKRFLEAHEVWSGGHNNYDPKARAEIDNGGFENEIIQTRAGFSWSFAENSKSLGVALDAHESLSGTHSLRLNFGGNSNPTTRIVSQVVLVEPETQYTLNFAARTDDIIAGGLPVVTVMDATADDEHLLAQSAPLGGTRDWQKMSVEFKTKNACAVLIVIRRQKCKTEICPVFGTAWFDDFSLQDHSDLGVTAKNQEARQVWQAKGD